MFLSKRATPALHNITRPTFQRPHHPHNTLLPICRAYSTPSEPPLLSRNIPAPHLGHIRVLELNRPAAKNALSVELVSLLEREVSEIEAQDGSGPTRALILASKVDGVFCAGADLKERKGMSKVEVKNFLATLHSTFSKLSTLQIPTLSSLSGVALGGGLELALTTHLRLFSSSTLVGLPETRLGIIPGAGGTHRLPALIGPSRARDLMLTGRRVSAAEAYFMGLCDRLVDIDQLPETEETEGKSELVLARETVLREAVGLASQICEGGPVAIKAVLSAVEGVPSQEKENKAYASVLETEDRMEALRAFAEKRLPVFKGR